MKSETAVLGLFQPSHWHTYCHVEKHGIEVEISPKLFPVVSVFCFSFIADCATALISSTDFGQWKRTHWAAYRETHAPLISV